MDEELIDEEEAFEGLQEVGYSKKKINEFLERGLTKKLYELLLRAKEEKITIDELGHILFDYFNNNGRAVKFGRKSDGNTKDYLNIALKYFGYRCALSGEEFSSFGKDGVENLAARSNLSGEHVVPLCQGGDDIYSNLVPAVLQYNLSKNGYNCIDWWKQAKDKDGKDIYSPYRLLKLINYMMKSIEARDKGLDIEDYEKAILDPNEIDKFLQEIEKEDEEEQDNSRRKIKSDVITTTELYEDEKKILTKLPDIKGNKKRNISKPKEQQREKYDEIKAMDIFLANAIRALKEDKELSEHEEYDEIISNLESMYEGVVGVIPFEIEVMNKIIDRLEEMGINENIYTIANELLRNTDILKVAKENKEGIDEYIVHFFEDKWRLLSEELNLTEEQIKVVIINKPNALVDEKVRNRIIFYQEYRIDRLDSYIKGESDATDNYIDILIIFQNNGIDVRTITQQNKQIIEYLKEQNEKRTEQRKIDIDKVIKEIEENGIITIDLNIGNMQNNQKSRNKEKYENNLKEARGKTGEKIFSDGLIRFLTKEQDATRDLIEVLTILQNNGIDLKTIPNSDRLLIDYLKKQNEKRKYQGKVDIDKILKEIEERGIATENFNIGNKQQDQKSRNKDKYEKYLREATDERGKKIFSDEVIKFLIKEQDVARDLVEVLIILQSNGIDVRTITQRDESLIDYLKKQNEKRKYQGKVYIDKILREIEERGIATEDFNIGVIQRNQKSRNRDIYEQYLREARDKTGEKIFNDGVIAFLVKKQDATRDLVDILIILQSNGIDVRTIPKKNKIFIDYLKEQNEKRLDQNKINIDKILKEIEEKGIVTEDFNIGNRQQRQKLDKRDKYEQYLREAKNENGERIFSDEVIESLLETRTNAQDIGKASYTASTSGCDEKQEELNSLENNIEERVSDFNNE